MVTVRKPWLAEGKAYMTCSYKAPEQLMSSLVSWYIQIKIDCRASIQCIHTKHDCFVNCQSMSNGGSLHECWLLNVLRSEPSLSLFACVCVCVCVCVRVCKMHVSCELVPVHACVTCKHCFYNFKFNLYLNMHVCTYVPRLPILYLSRGYLDPLPDFLGGIFAPS